jgi:hypothetical protein
MSTVKNKENKEIYRHALNMMIDPSIHHRAKAYGATHGLKLYEVIEQAIDTYLRDHDNPL